MISVDVIDAILGPASSAAVSGLRGQKPELGAQMQDYYDAVFAPSASSAAALVPAERWLIAVRTAAHSGSQAVVDWYAGRAQDAGVEAVVIDSAADVTSPWVRDQRGAAIMRHVDLIVTHPVDSEQSDIERLSAVGLTPAGIVALSQVVAYVSYQLRLIAALRALGEPS